MEYVATDALFPDWQIWNSFVGSEGLSSQRRDSLPGVQSVRTAVNHPDEIGSLFDPSIVYAKGGRLLNMLMNYLGTDAFRKGLKLYFDKHAYGNTTGDDLWEALSTASGKDVASFMTPWLTRSGFPLLTVDQAGPQLTINQQHFLVDPAQADDRIWPVPLLSDDAQIPQLLETKELSTDLENPDFIRINHGAVGHYIVRYAEPAHADAIAQLAESKSLTPSERLMLLSDSSLVARAGIASFGETLALLKHYAQEDTESGWDIIALSLADARRFVDLDETLEDSIKAFIRQFIQIQFERLGFEPRPDESAEDGKLRATIIGLGVYSEHPEIKQWALDSFEGYKKDDASVVSELRSIVFGAAVRNDVPGAFDYLLKLEESTSNPDLKSELLGALTLSKLPERATQLLGRIKDSSKVRQHDVDAWIVYLLRNRYVRDLAWNWLRDNWDWIEVTFEGDKGYDSFPRYAASTFNTRQLADEYKAFFEPKLKDVALTRNITLGMEELASRVAWLERDLTAVQSFFKS
jgi:aminopeptidase N